MNKTLNAIETHTFLLANEKTCGCSFLIGTKLIHGSS